MQYKILFPVAALLLFLLLDKILLIPSVQQCCTKKRVGGFFQSSLHDELPEEILRAAREPGAELIVNLGSSLSYGFYARQQNPTNTIVLNLAYPGASMLTTYVRLNQVLDRGIRPARVLIEYTPAVFNKSTPWYPDEVLHGIPFDFALRYARELPGEHLQKVIASRVFAIRRFRPGLPDEKSSAIEAWFQKFLALYSESGSLSFARSGFRPGTEPPERKQQYDFYKIILQSIFLGYRIDPHLKQYLLLILRRLDQEKIPAVFWMPKMHPVTLEIWQKFINQKNWRALSTEIQQKGGNYVDLNAPGRMQCDFFIDPMHMALQCFPEALQILQAVPVEQPKPSK